MEITVPSVHDSSLAPAGKHVLSAIVFSMSMAARPLARRIQESEALARQRGVDLQNLSELNEYIVQHLRESIIVVDARRVVWYRPRMRPKIPIPKVDCTI